MPSLTFEEIAERVARSRFSFIITFIAVKVLVHWPALYILAHPDGRPWNARDALSEALRYIGAMPLWLTWLVPAAAALGVSAGYPWLAAWLRTFAETANRWYAQRHDRIHDRTLERQLGVAMHDLNRANKGIGRLREELIKAYAHAHSGIEAKAFPYVTPERFYVRDPDGNLQLPDADSLRTLKEPPYYAFLGVQDANLVFASQDKFPFPKGKPAITALTAEGEQREDKSGGAWAFRVAPTSKGSPTWELRTFKEDQNRIAVMNEIAQSIQQGDESSVSALDVSES